MTAFIYRIRIIMILKSASYICVKFDRALCSLYPQTTLVFFGMMLACSLSLAETSNTYLQWECDTGQNGEWVCGQQSVAGKSYPRPVKTGAFDVFRGEEKQTELVPKVKIAKNSDWVDEENLSTNQLVARSSGCCGAYIEPERNYPDSDLKPENASLRVASTSTELIQDNVAYLKGNVHLTQGYRQARSDAATLNQDNRTVDMEGHIELREPGLLLKGDTAHVNMDSLDIEISNASYLLHESGARGSASALKRPGGDIFYIDNGTYTTCEPGSNAWRLISSKLQINPGTGIATAKHVRLEIKDIPVIYVPWVRFSIDDRRTSGLLFPTWERSEENGLDFSQPIYLNLAPNYDATFTPRYVQERGAMAELEMRHLSGLSETILSGAFLASDDGGDDNDEILNAVTGKRENEGENRWLADIRHRGDFGHLRSALSYTRVSDEDYFQDLGITTLQVNSQSYLRQHGNLDFSIKNWDISIEGSGYQTLIKDGADQYELLPRIQANKNFSVGNFDFDLKNQYSDYAHNDSAKTTGRRLNLAYAASWNKWWNWGYLRPTIKVKHMTYDLDSSVSGQNDDRPSVTVPIGIIDTGIYLERKTTWLNGYTHTFEPRLYIVYAKKENQDDLPLFDTTLSTFQYSSLFRDEQFIGGDRVTDSKQVSVGLTTRLIDDDSGIERMRASIGQIFYLDDRTVSINSPISKETRRDESPYAAEFEMSLGDNWKAFADVQYDSDDKELDRASTSLRYNGGDNKLFNVSYRFNNQTPVTLNGKEYKNDIEQSDFSTALPITRNLSIVGRYNYDVTNSRILETFFGFQYESCCVRLNLLARKWIDRDDNIALPMDDLEEDTGIFLSFQIKGIAGFGSKMDSMVADGIHGYETPK
jgi:LPS-assembly protein